MAKSPKGGGQGKGGSSKISRESKTGRFVIEKSVTHRNAKTVRDNAPGRAMPPDPRPPKEKK